MEVGSASLQLRPAFRCTQRMHAQKKRLPRRVDRTAPVKANLSDATTSRPGAAGAPPQTRCCPAVPGRASMPRKDRTVPGVDLSVESARPLTSRLKRLAMLAVALMALGGGLSGCGETKAEEDHGNTAGQESQSEQQPDEEEAPAPSGGSSTPRGKSSRSRESPPSKSSGDSSGEQDEAGSSSHASDSSFCSEHHCIGSFTTEGGTIVACSDGTYTHAGGLSGACSGHGGERE
jgi:hypothetical protein